MQVRPRRIWIGATTAVIGMVVIGLAMTFSRWQPWGWIGIALLALGAVAALLGGILSDVYGGHGGLSGERRAVLRGETRAGTDAGSMVPAGSTMPADPATANAGAAEPTHLGPAPHLARLRLLALLLVLVGAWAILAPTLLHNPDTETGNDIVLRDYAVAALVLLSGLALRNPRRPRVVAAVPAVAGAALLLAAALSPPLATRMLVSEVVTGVLAASLALGYLVLRMTPG